MTDLLGEFNMNIPQFLALWNAGHLIVPVAKEALPEGGEKIVAVAVVMQSVSLLTDRKMYEIIFRATTPSFNVQDMLRYVVSGAEFNGVHEVWDIERHGKLEIRRKVYDKAGIGVSKSAHDLLSKIKEMG